MLKAKDLPPEDREKFNALQYQVDKWLGDNILDGMAWLLPDMDLESEISEDIAKLPSGTHVVLTYGFEIVTEDEVEELRKEIEENP